MDEVTTTGPHPHKPNPIDIRCEKYGRGKRVGKEWHIGEWQMAKFKYFLPSVVPWRAAGKNKEMGSG